MRKFYDYLDLREQHQKELTDFPIVYAFNDQQLKEGLEKLGAEKSECVTVFGHGDIVKRKDAPRLIAMLERHVKELHAALQADEEFAENAFLYEMDNHEYAINWDGDEAILDCFNLTEEKLREMNLVDAYIRARNLHMKRAENIGMI